MKKQLTASLALNGVLLALVAGLVIFRPAQNRPVSAPTVAASKISPAAAAPARPESPKATPFHWNQMEADDYATFITNLRSIGCPEPTIRQIVQGEVSELYADKQRQLRSSAGHNPLPSEIRKLEQEQSTVLAGLLQDPKKNQISEATVPGSLAARAKQVRIQYPLVFQNPAATPPGGKGRAVSNARSPLPPPTPAQEQTINQISQNFVKDIGGPHQNPTDPQYHARWTRAQRNADEMMRSLMGATYYMTYHNEIARKAYEEQLKQAK